MPTGWKVSKIQGSAISYVTVTHQIKDLAANMKTELIFYLQNLTFTLQMSTFIDMAELVLSAPTTLQKTFLYKCSAADTSGHKYTKGWIIFLTLIVYAGTTSFPFALSVQQGWQRKLLAHNMSRQRHQTLLVVGVMDFVPATHLWFKKKKIHFHLMPWIKH